MIRSIPYSLRFLKNVMQSAQVQICTFHIFIIRCCCSNPCHYHNVQTSRQLLLIQSKTFPNQPGYAVSDHTVSYFFTHRDPYSLPWELCSLYIHYQFFIGIRLAGTIHCLKIHTFFNTRKFSHQITPDPLPPMLISSITRFKYLSVSARILFRECRGKSGGVVGLR